MNQFLHFIMQFSGTLNRFIGRALSWLLLGMTISTLVVIICAAVFRAGWVWLGELTVYMHGMVLMLGAAYTLHHNGHVRIDIFYNKFSPRIQGYINLFGTLFLLFPVCITILWYSAPYAISSWEVLESSPEGEGLPAVFLLKTCIPLAAVLLLLEGLAIIARAMIEIITPPQK